MTNETANKIAVEIATDYSIDIVDIRGILGRKIDDLDITLIDMTQYVKRSKVEDMLSSLQTVIDAPPDGEYERGHGDGMDTACREFRSLLDDTQESETQGDEQGVAAEVKQGDIEWGLRMCRKISEEFSQVIADAMSDWPTRWLSVAEDGLPESREGGYWTLRDGYHVFEPEYYTPDVEWDSGITHYCPAPPLPVQESDEIGGVWKCDVCGGKTSPCFVITTDANCPPIRCPWSGPDQPRLFKRCTEAEAVASLKAVKP